ncbi:MAG: PIN domain-containing protein [Chloroflexota bacterium]|nr:MAG: PIN domain-containing protein [Chloroflexota bacterium]
MFSTVIVHRFLVGRLLGSPIEATTTIETLQEFAHVLARRRSRTDTAVLARRYAVAFSLLETHEDDLELGLTLFERCPDLGLFDAVLAAVALNRQAEALVSADRAFATVPQLAWIDPATPALDRLIGG